MRVNEIFYSIQGEGYFTGKAAVFLRLSGCNLTCDFCDTEHLPFIEMSDEDIITEVSKYPTKHIVITGGEPMLQLTPTFIEKLHCSGFFVQIETNGTRFDLDVLSKIDWVTCSPKFEFCKNAEIKLEIIDELKVVYQGQDMSKYNDIVAPFYYVQPCDVKDEQQNAEILEKTIEFIKLNPLWRLSLQTQKILKVR